MSVIRDYVTTDVQNGGCVATIGNFDGVHVGHQKLVEKLIEIAKSRQLPSRVMTFEPSPREVFDDQAAPRLTKFTDKMYFLKHLGVDDVVVFKFNHAFMQVSPLSFINDILHQKYAVRHLLVGQDFKFGANKAGDVHFLGEHAAKSGIEVETFDDWQVGGMRVSSTLIRTLLHEGDFSKAAQLLGRTYAIKGRVQHGDKRGRLLGFPTANIALKNDCPMKGVYLVKVHELGWGVANIGHRPTFQGTKRLLEVHLFDFCQDIYGQKLTVEPIKKIRDEQSFASFELLRKQIQQDIHMALKSVEKHNE